MLITGVQCILIVIAVVARVARGGASRATVRRRRPRRQESQLVVMCDRWRIATMHRTRSEHDNTSFNFIYIQPTSGVSAGSRVHAAPAAGRGRPLVLNMLHAAF